MVKQQLADAQPEDVYVFPTSFAQQRLWFLNELMPGSTIYNLPTAVRLKGDLNIAALEKSINEIIRRHEALRTTFTAKDGKPMQVVRPAVPLILEVKPLPRIAGQDQEAQIRQAAKTEAHAPFDLGRGPLLRASLLQLEPDEYILLFTVHHIVSDGWSKGILIREVAALYEAFSSGRPSPLEELPIQYADYAIWQRDWLQGPALEEQLAYWRTHLAGAPPALELPIDKPRPALQTHRGATRRTELSLEHTEALKSLSQRNGVTLFMTTLAAFQALLYRYTGQEDIVVGAPIAGRGRLETEGLIGFFVNTLALRSTIVPEESFRSFLGRVQETVLGAYARQDVPFEKLVEELQPERNLRHSPIFQVMIVMQNAPRDTLEMAGIKVNGLTAEGAPAKFDLTLTLTEREGRLTVLLGYNLDLFEAETAGRMLSHFESLLRAIVENPDARVGSLPMLAEQERELMLREWNATARDYPKGRTLPAIFEKQVQATPDRTALIADGVALSYQDLNRRANQLANYLQSLDVGSVGPETIVGLLMERSVEMIIAVLGILKAGGAYVPLDPAYPPERINFILDDTRASILLTERTLADRIHPCAARLVFLDEQWEAIGRCADVTLPGAAKEDNLAYVIYTSGSTGRPKGVAIEHRSAVALCDWAQEWFEPAELSGVLAATSICFDLSIFEIFSTLGGGGTAILAQNILHLVSLPARDAVTLVNTVPSAMAELTRINGVPDSVKTVVLAGETLSSGLAQEIYRQAKVQKVFNLYGPSEDTTYSTGTLTPKGETREPAIGRPISNTQTYTLARSGELTPMGAAGEIYIGGDGLARSYLRRPALTAEKFLPDPFSGRSGARLYRTGDIARNRPNGELEFLGRSDHQVKIRGYRVELGEVEAALVGCAGVRQAIVIARRAQGGDLRLAAYVIGDALDITEVRKQIREQLPEYMIPAWFVTLDQAPLTPNGKIDRKALPNPEQLYADDKRERLAPRNPVEQTLVDIWGQILRLEQIGVDENFFELGGHSLLATQVVSRMREAFKIEIPLRSLFEAPTIEQQAMAIEALKQRGAALQGPAIGRVARSQYRAKAEAEVEN